MNRTDTLYCQRHQWICYPEINWKVVKAKNIGKDSQMLASENLIWLVVLLFSMNLLAVAFPGSRRSIRI